MNSYPTGNNKNHNHKDDPLVCAVEAMRHQHAPDGPPPEVEAHLLNRIGQLDDEVQPPPLPTATEPVRERTFKMQSLTKYAAAILIVGILAVVAIVNLTPSAPAFADVRANVLATRTMSCFMVLNFDKAPQPGAPTHMELKLIAKNPGWLRQEMSMPHPQNKGQKMTMVQVISYKDGKILSLMPSEKVATEIKFDLKDFGQQPQNFNIVDEFSKMDDEDGKYVRTETVDGRELLVYEIDHNAGKTVSNAMFGGENLAMKATMWVDADSRLPVRMTMDMSGSLGMKMEMKDFEWDVDVPDHLLSLEIPKGYQKHSMDMAGVTEKDLVNTLKVWAEVNDDTFPDEFSQAALQGAMVKIAKSLDGTPNEEDILKIAQEFTRGFMFVATFMEGGEFKYQGKGVILGEGDRIVCYFRKKDEPNYRAIFGDLSVGELTPEDLKGRAED